MTAKFLARIDLSSLCTMRHFEVVVAVVSERCAESRSSMTIHRILPCRGLDDTRLLYNLSVNLVVVPVRAPCVGAEP